VASPLHVAVSGAFLTQPLTGAQRYAGELLDAMAERSAGRVRFTLLVPTGGGRRIERAPPAGVDVRRDATPWPTAWWTQRRLPRLVAGEAADLLWSPANVGPLSVARQVVTILDAAVFACPEAFSLPFRTYYRWLLPRLGRRAARVVTISEFSRGELGRWGIAGADRVDVVPPGVAAVFRPEADTSRWDALKPYVLAVGSRDPRKDLEVLLRAWREVAPRLRPSRRLAIAGGTSSIFAREPPGEPAAGVTVLGRVADEDLAGLYAGAECLVYPSRYEGFGLPPLEAMASGVPAIVARAASLPEACGEAALYVEPGDPQGLASAIETLCGDAALASRLRRLGARQAERWSWERSADLMLDVLRRAALHSSYWHVGGKRGGPS